MTKWTWKCGLATSLALSLALFACGDDDEKEEHEHDAGQDASSGSDADAEDSGGGGVTAAQCIENTPDAVPSACASCLCNADPEVANDCATNTSCWALLNCVTANCDVPEAEIQACAIANCGAHLAGATQAQANGMLIAASCDSECNPPPAEDAGTDAATDAGDGDAATDAGDGDAGDGDAATDAGDGDAATDAG